jgi:hypothetical protein
MRDINWRLSWNRFCIRKNSTGNREAVLGGYCRVMQILNSFTQVPMEGGNKKSAHWILSQG